MLAAVSLATLHRRSLERIILGRRQSLGLRESSHFGWGVAELMTAALELGGRHVAKPREQPRVVPPGPGQTTACEPAADLLREGALELAPADERTRLLALGGDVCRDVVFLAEACAKPETRRRASTAFSRVKTTSAQTDGRAPCGRRPHPFTHRVT